MEKIQTDSKDRPKEEIKLISMHIFVDPFVDLKEEMINEEKNKRELTKKKEKEKVTRILSLSFSFSLSPPLSLYLPSLSLFLSFKLISYIAAHCNKL